MIPVLASRGCDDGDVVRDYQAYVEGLPITLGARRDRIYRARRFLATHPDLDEWMRRPTAARLRDLHRPKAWPLATWLFVTGRVRPDLELLLTKPPGCDLPSVWAGLHADDVARVEDTAMQLGWSRNWTRQVVILAASMICVWTAKTVDELIDDDFDAILAALDDSPAVTASARTRLQTRLFSFHHICFQLGICSDRTTAWPAAVTDRRRARRDDPAARHRPRGRPLRRTRSPPC